jgi:hypothetical protein
MSSSTIIAGGSGAAVWRCTSEAGPKSEIRISRFETNSNSKRGNLETPGVSSAYDHFTGCLINETHLRVRHESKSGIALGGAREPGEIVNVIFVKGGQRVKTLLVNDGLVLSHYVSGRYQSERLQPLLFLRASEDTDGNHILNKNEESCFGNESNASLRSRLHLRRRHDYLCQARCRGEYSGRIGRGDCAHFRQASYRTRAR